MRISGLLGASLALLVASNALAGCAGARLDAELPAGEPPAALAGRAVAEGIIAANNAFDLGRVLAYYADSAVLWPPNGEPVSGLAAIRERYEGLFATSKPELTIVVDAVRASDDLGIVEGRIRGRRVDRQGGAEHPVDDRFMMVVAPEGDRGWRIRHLVWR